MMLNEKTFLQLALRQYDNPACISVDEFKQDLDRFSHIKKLLNRYKAGSPANERLILNHLVVCFNVFGDATVQLIFYKVDKSIWGSLIPYLIFLNRITTDTKIDSIQLSDIQLDKNIIDILRQL